MGLPDSWYTSTRIFPLLDKQSTERRYNWAKAFWIFWNTATGLSLSVLTAPSEENNSDEQTQADDNEQTQADEGGALVSRAI